VWDSGSNPYQIPTSLTESFGNIYWEGAWQEAMNRYSDYDAVWLLGCDIGLNNSPQEYKDSLEKLIATGNLGCWSPSVDGRAHPFMLKPHYNNKSICSVKNVEGMAMAVSGKLMKAVGGKFDVRTEKGFGQDYWFCAMARRNKLANYIDGSLSVIHPPEIGYNETEAHDLMEREFSKKYGKDFRRTLFEYSENFQGNLLEENVMEIVRGGLSGSLTIATVDNGWGVTEFESVTKSFTQCRRIIMCKGVSDFSSETTAEIIPYDENLSEILKADIILFARIGAANKEEFMKILEAGIPVIVKEGYDQGKIQHEKNGFIYGHESWGTGWIHKLVEDEGLRLRIGGKAAHDSKQEPSQTQPKAEDSSKSESDVKVTIITPTYKRDPRIVSRCINCVQLQTVTNIEQLVCSDGAPESAIASLVGSIADERITYHHTTVKKPGDYGNTVRSEMLARARGDYILFMDDDNLILPDYLEKMIKAIEESGKDFAVCRVVHFGPLNEEQYGKKPPVVLTGLPVKLYHVDPLQILVKRAAMQDIGWETEKGYLADGHTLQALGDKFEHVEVADVLGFHM
jgi:hypothetical protein